MEMIESSEQFRQRVQQTLQRIEDKINDLSNSGYNDNQKVNDETNTLLDRLKNQQQLLKEALERYGSETADNWEKVKSEAQYILQDVENNWLTGVVNI